MPRQRSTRNTPPRARTVSLAADLFVVLTGGVTSRYDIAVQLGGMRGENFTVKQIDTLLHQVRKFRDYFGWMPHYASTGENITSENRFMIVRRDHAGVWHTPAEHKGFEEGTLNKALASMTYVRTVAAQARMRAVNTVDARKKRILLERADDADYYSRKIQSLVDDLMNGTF